MILMVSAKVSPFLLIEVFDASEKPITCPPRRWIEVSNESLVRVEASKKQLAITRSLRSV